MSVPVDTPALLDTRAAARHVDLAYEHFVRLRSAGRTPSPDGWDGRRPLYAASTLSAWLAERGGKRSWKLAPVAGGQVDSCVGTEAPELIDDTGEQAA